MQALLLSFHQEAGEQQSIKLVNCNESGVIGLLPWAILLCLAMLMKFLDLNQNPDGLICNVRNRKETCFPYGKQFISEGEIVYNLLDRSTFFTASIVLKFID